MSRCSFSFVWINRPRCDSSTSFAIASKPRLRRCDAPLDSPPPLAAADTITGGVGTFTSIDKLDRRVREGEKGAKRDLDLGAVSSLAFFPFLKISLRSPSRAGTALESKSAASEL